MMVNTAPALPVIAADRFVLRPLRRSDAGLLSLHAGDRRVAEATRSIPHPLPPGATEAFIARALAGQGGEDVWVMDGSEQGSAEVLGVISLTRLDAVGRRGAPEAAANGQSQIGYWVAPAFWNTGVATAAVRALVAANPHAARTLFAEVFQDNPVSARVLTNCGFEYLGDAEAHSVARGGKVATWTYLLRLR